MTQSDAEVDDMLSALAGLVRREREEIEGSDLSDPILSELTAAEIAVVQAGVLKRLQLGRGESAADAASTTQSSQVVPLRRWGPLAVLMLWPAVTAAAAVIVALRFAPDATPRGALSEATRNDGPPQPPDTTGPHPIITAAESGLPFMPPAEAGNPPEKPNTAPRNRATPDALSRALLKEARSFLLRAEQAAAKAAEAVARGLTEQHPEVIRWRTTERRWRARASELLVGKPASKEGLRPQLGSDRQGTTRTSFR